MRYSKSNIAAVAGFLVVAATSTKLLAAQAFFLCTPAEVAVTKELGANERVHVRCATALSDAGNSVIYFAVPASDTAYVNRFVTLATTALTAGRTLTIGYDFGKVTDLNNVAFGCVASSCRYARQINLN